MKPMAFDPQREEAILVLKLGREQSRRLNCFPMRRIHLPSRELAIFVEVLPALKLEGGSFSHSEVVVAFMDGVEVIRRNMFYPVRIFSAEFGGAVEVAGRTLGFPVVAIASGEFGIWNSSDSL